MPWETDFIRLLDKPEADKPLVFALRRITFPDWGASATILPNSGGIVDGSIRTVGYSLNSQSAAVQGGGFEIELADQSWVTTMRKGDVFELLACFKEEGEVFEWNTIDIGVLEDIEVTGTTAHLVCSGFQSIARSRRTNVVGEQMLYFDMYDGVSDVEFIDYDPDDSTIVVDDLAKFLRETGDDGLVRIQKDDGSWYYATYTGTSGGDTLTGVTPDVLDTDAEVVTGNRIHPVPWLYGHPIAIWEKSLTSTGTGLNGSRDDYPKSWGFALTDTYVDAIDMALWQDASEDSFIYLWPDDGGSNDFRDFEIQGDWYAWFTGITRNLGFYPCLVEGAVSMRCLVSEDIVVETWGFEMEITDEDLIDGPDGITSHLWSPAHAAQFHRLVIFGNSFDDFVDADIADFLPAARLAITAAPHVRGGVEPDVLADAVERMKPWFVGTDEVAVPQLLVLRGRSLKFAQLALGDKPLFSTERIRSVEGSAITENRPTVVGVIPDWNRGTCTLMLAIFPVAAAPTPFRDAIVENMPGLMGIWLAPVGVENEEAIADDAVALEEVTGSGEPDFLSSNSSSGNHKFKTDDNPTDEFATRGVVDLSNHFITEYLAIATTLSAKYRCGGIVFKATDLSPGEIALVDVAGTHASPHNVSDGDHTGQALITDYNGFDADMIPPSPSGIPRDGSHGSGFFLGYGTGYTGWVHLQWATTSSGASNIRTYCMKLGSAWAHMYGLTSDGDHPWVETGATASDGISDAFQIGYGGSHDSGTFKIAAVYVGNDDALSTAALEAIHDALA